MVHGVHGYHNHPRITAFGAPICAKLWITLDFLFTTIASQTRETIQELEINTAIVLKLPENIRSRRLRGRKRTGMGLQTDYVVQKTCRCHFWKLLLSQNVQSAASVPGSAYCSGQVYTFDRSFKIDCERT